MAQINFIPNDPLAANGPTMRRIRPPRYPRGSAARFDVRPSAVSGLYEVHTPQFDHWQTQTALIRGLRAWRGIDGTYLPRWQGNRQVLPVRTNAGDDLNAFYDRASLQFFSHSFNGRTVHSCESPDVANHEQGHAMLDAIRPDFWDAPFIEVGALHESFGDCFAILVALTDATTRRLAITAAPNLGSHQFLEQLAEELADAIRREFGAQYVEPGALRRALNTFRWSDPTKLPAQAPASQLSREVHSFSRVFTGCFYDVIRNIYNAGAHTSSGLRKAALKAGELLVSAIRTVPVTPRLFEGVGRRMLQGDIQNGDGTHVQHIRAAFAAHGIALGAPVSSLPAPLTVGRTAASATRALRERLGLSAQERLAFTPVGSDMHGNIAHVAAYRATRLKGAALKGLRIMVPTIARVQMHGRAIVGLLGDPIMPAQADAESEAQAFAQGLVANGDLALDQRRTMTRKRPRRATHVVKLVAGKRTVVRRGFACGAREG